MRVIGHLRDAPILVLFAMAFLMLAGNVLVDTWSSSATTTSNNLILHIQLLETNGDDVRAYCVGDYLVVTTPHGVVSLGRDTRYCLRNQ